MHTATICPITPELQPTSNQPVQFDPQADRLGSMFENLHVRIAGIERLIYSTNNQVQLRLTTYHSAKAREQPLAIRAKKGECI